MKVTRLLLLVNKGGFCVVEWVECLAWECNLGFIKLRKFPSERAFSTL